MKPEEIPNASSPLEPDQPAAAEPSADPAEAAPEETPEAEEKPPYKPYSRSTRIKAWLGVAFMVFLVLMYTYSLASGKIMEW